MENSINKQAPPDKIYLLKHKLLSDVIKFSISHKHSQEFIEHLSSSSNSLKQFTFVSKINCQNPLSVIERVQRSLQTHLTYGELYQISPEDALKVVQREALRIPSHSID